MHQKMKQNVIEERKSASVEDDLSSNDVSPVNKPSAIKSSGSVFVQENRGSIKDFYKISKCIGRGKFCISNN